MDWIYYVLIANCIWSFTSLIDKIVISKGYIKNPLVYLATNGLMNIKFNIKNEESQPYQNKG